MATARCPTCNQQFDPAASRAMPFCSPRCKAIDLNRWLKEEISIPFQETGDETEPPRRDEPEDDDD